MNAILKAAQELVAADQAVQKTAAKLAVAQKNHDQAMAAYERASEKMRVVASA